MKPSDQALQEIFSFIPFLEKAKQDKASIGAWVSNPGQWPWVQYTETTEKLRRALLIPELIDTHYVEKLSPKWLEEPGIIGSLSESEIATLITGIFRQERFNDGVVLEEIHNGHMLEIVQRLKGLKSVSRS